MDAARYSGASGSGRHQRGPPRGQHRNNPGGHRRGRPPAAVASSSTYAMGEAWGVGCGMMLDGKFGPLEQMDNGKIRSVFVDRSSARCSPAR